MAIARMRSVVLDCPDPKQLADFYSALLGWQIWRGMHQPLTLHFDWTLRHVNHLSCIYAGR